MAPAPAPASPGQLQRAASSEPCATRPNPFDDTDSSSRKRQRTSLSSSPTQNTDARADEELESSSPTLIMSHAASGGDELAADPAGPTQQRGMTSDLPSTPEAPVTADHHTPQTPSSRVTTINLRHANGSAYELCFPKPPSPSPRPPATQGFEPDATVPELDLVQAPSPNMETSNDPNLASDSPPVEVITIPDDGDDEDEISLVGVRSSNASITMIGAEQPFIDPMENFPFKDPDEQPQETVHRLMHYISTRKTTQTIVITCAELTNLLLQNKR
jgi:ubiquitin carboxyl-terminal hydrolase 34